MWQVQYLSHKKICFFLKKRLVFIFVGATILLSKAVSHCADKE
jgi:hypothetical protein